MQPNSVQQRADGIERKIGEARRLLEQMPDRPTPRDFATAFLGIGNAKVLSATEVLKADAERARLSATLEGYGGCARRGAAMIR